MQKRHQLLLKNTSTICTVEVFLGNAIKAHIDTIAIMRIKNFSDFPYLSRANLTTEREYLQNYPRCEYSITLIAKANEDVIGILTGMPLVNDTEIFVAEENIFREQGLNAADYYWLGEIIIEKKYQNQGLGKQLLTIAESYVKKWNYKHVCLGTIIREDNHPLKPNYYQNTDAIWQNFGFTQTSMRVVYTWPSLAVEGHVEEAKNPHAIWAKMIY